VAEHHRDRESKKRRVQQRVVYEARFERRRLDGEQRGDAEPCICRQHADGDVARDTWLTHRAARDVVHREPCVNASRPQPIVRTPIAGATVVDAAPASVVIAASVNHTRALREG